MKLLVLVLILCVVGLRAVNLDGTAKKDTSNILTRSKRFFNLDTLLFGRRTYNNYGSGK